MHYFEAIDILCKKFVEDAPDNQKEAAEATAVVARKILRNINEITIALNEIATYFRFKA